MFERVRSQIKARAEIIERDLRSCEGLATELNRIPPERRREAVRAHGRFASRGLTERLLTEVSQSWAADPARAEKQAQLALAVIPRLDSEVFGHGPLNDLHARAWAYLATAQRIRSDLLNAEGSFATADSFLEQGSGDPMARAEILELEASFARAQRRFNDALALLHQVSAAYHKAGDRHLVGRALVSKASVHGYAGRPEKSVTLLRKALELIDPGREPRVHMAARHQLILNLNEAGRSEEALALLPEVREETETVGTHLDRLRLRWVEGLIAADLGENEEAERALIEVRRGFIAADIGYDVALVSLDLAVLHLRQGRTRETRRLAAEMLPIFQSRDIHREALAALMVFRQAAELEKATLAMVRDIARYLRQARSDPSLRYERPS